jgi:hypothetical protein
MQLRGETFYKDIYKKLIWIGGDFSPFRLAGATSVPSLRMRTPIEETQEHESLPRLASAQVAAGVAEA